MSHTSLNDWSDRDVIFFSIPLNTHKILLQPTSDMVDLQTSLATDSNLGSVVRFSL